MKPLQISFLDGTSAEVVPTPGDIVRFERHFNIGVEQLEKGARLEHILFIAWTALRRTGDEGREFEEFLDAVGDAGEAPKAEVARLRKRSAG